MTTRVKMVAMARRNLGVVEGPNNRNPYAGMAGHANNQPWCATFLVACARAVGLKLPSESAYTPTMAAGFKREGAWHTRGQVGDFVFFRWPKLGRIAHVGIVESVEPNGFYVCIEGNTDVAGGRTGGKVMRHRRKANIAGFGRPAYTAPVQPAPKPKDAVLKLNSRGQQVLNVQRALNKYGHKVAMDGEFGPLTQRAVKDFQVRRGLKPTGIVNTAEWRELRESS